MMRSQQQQQQERRREEEEEDYQSKVLYELSTMVLNIIRSPPNTSVELRARRDHSLSFEQITPAGFASMLMGISLALMLCGSVTFFLGFILMPWVLGLVIFLYFVGILSTISMIARAIFTSTTTSSAITSPPPLLSKQDPHHHPIPSWKLL